TRYAGKPHRCRACKSSERLDACSLGCSLGLRCRLLGFLRRAGFETRFALLNRRGSWRASQPARLAHATTGWRQVRAESVAAGHPGVPRLLVTSERARWVETVERVRPDDTRRQTVGDAQDAAALVGPDSRRKPVRGVVRLRDRLR